MNADDHASEIRDSETAAELVAYLDGELDAESRRTVEERLSQDAAYRQRLRALQQSWDLLDHLPQATPDEAFTQSTVAMVACAAGGDAEDLKTRSGRQRRRFFWAGMAGAVAGFLAGYAAVATLTTRQNRRLLRDLAVIERLDEYRYAESLTFLQMLDREGLFAEEADEEVADDL